MVRTPQDRVRLNIYFDTRVLEAMRRLSELKGTTYSELIREACRDFILREGAVLLKNHGDLKEMTK